MVVKLFPASTVGVATPAGAAGAVPRFAGGPHGRISPTTAKQWLDAGAVAVGLGGELLPRALRQAHAWDQISHNASELLGKLREKQA